MSEELSRWLQLQPLLQPSLIRLKKHQSFVLFLAVLLLHRGIPSQASTEQLPLLPNPQESNVSRNSKAVRDLIRARCGPDGCAMWVYEGALYDPVTGKCIAEVEGLELVRLLAETSSGDDSNDRIQFRDRTKDLLINQAVFPNKREDKPTTKSRTHRQQPQHDTTTAASLEYGATILSRKLFCYREPGSKSESTSLLKSVRLRPTSPERCIPMDQSCTVFDVASSMFVQQPTGDVILHGEWPDGRAVWSLADQVQTSEADILLSKNMGDRIRRRRTLEFSLYARPRTKRNSVPDLTAISNPAVPPNAAVTTSPPRSAWVQFGPSKVESQGKFGARETYRYEMELTDDDQAATDASQDESTLSSSPAQKKQSPLQSLFQRSNKNDEVQPPKPFPPPEFPRDDSLSSSSSCTLRYTRYGEGPVWYGAGRTCTLELTGKRVDNFTPPHVPGLASVVAAVQIPGFLSVNTPVDPKDVGDAQRAVQGFRNNAAQLMVMNEDDDEYDGSDDHHQGFSTNDLWGHAPSERRPRRGRRSRWMASTAKTVGKASSNIFSRLKAATVIRSLADVDDARDREDWE